MKASISPTNSPRTPYRPQSSMRPQSSEPSGSIQHVQNKEITSEDMETVSTKLLDKYKGYVGEPNYNSFATRKNDLNDILLKIYKTVLDTYKNHSHQLTDLSKFTRGILGSLNSEMGKKEFEHQEIFILIQSLLSLNLDSYTERGCGSGDLKTCGGSKTCARTCGVSEGATGLSVNSNITDIEDLVPSRLTTNTTAPTSGANLSGADDSEDDDLDLDINSDGVEKLRTEMEQKISETYNETTIRNLIETAAENKAFIPHNLLFLMKPELNEMSHPHSSTSKCSLS